MKLVIFCWSLSTFFLGILWLFWVFFTITGETSGGIKLIFEWVVLFCKGSFYLKLLSTSKIQEKKAKFYMKFFDLSN